MKEAQQAEDLQKEQKADSFREPRNKGRKEKDNTIGIRSIDKKASSTKNFDDSLKTFDKDGLIEKALLEH